MLLHSKYTNGNQFLISESQVAFWSVVETSSQRAGKLENVLEGAKAFFHFRATEDLTEYASIAKVKCPAAEHLGYESTPSVIPIINPPLLPTSANRVIATRENRSWLKSAPAAQHAESLADAGVLVCRLSKLSHS
jgi:hypothetical protein